MAVGVQFTFLGDKQINRTLDGIVDRVTDASPALEALGDRLARAEEQQFATEGGYGSGGWAPLSPKYAAWKARHFPGAPVLVRSGDLRDSLTSRPFGIDVVDRLTAVFGTGVEYAGYHQSGTPKMPARKPMELPDSERREWMKVIQRFLITGRT